MATVSYNDGTSDVPVEKGVDGYTFTMPAKEVTVTVTFGEIVNVVPANLGVSADNYADGPANGLATNYTASGVVINGEKIITVHADSLTAHTSSDSQQATLGNKYWIGVGLPWVDTSSNTLYGTTDDVNWNPYRVHEVTLNGVKYSMTYATLSEGTMGLTVKYKVTADADGHGNPNGEISAEYTVTYTAGELVPATEVTP